MGALDAAEHPAGARPDALRFRAARKARGKRRGLPRPRRCERRAVPSRRTTCRRPCASCCGKRLQEKSPRRRRRSPASTTALRNRTPRPCAGLKKDHRGAFTSPQHRRRRQSGRLPEPAHRGRDRAAGLRRPDRGHGDRQHRGADDRRRRAARCTARARRDPRELPDPVFTPRGKEKTTC